MCDVIIVWCSISFTSQLYTFFFSFQRWYVTVSLNKQYAVDWIKQVKQILLLVCKRLAILKVGVSSIGFLPHQWGVSSQCPHAPSVCTVDHMMSLLIPFPPPHLPLLLLHPLCISYIARTTCGWLLCDHMSEHGTVFDCRAYVCCNSDVILF